MTNAVELRLLSLSFMFFRLFPPAPLTGCLTCSSLGSHHLVTSSASQPSLLDNILSTGHCCHFPGLSSVHKVPQVPPAADKNKRGQSCVMLFCVVAKHTSSSPSMFAQLVESPSHILSAHIVYMNQRETALSDFMYCPPAFHETQIYNHRG